jgi:hypothetical protein
MIRREHGPWARPQYSLRRLLIFVFVSTVWTYPRLVGAGFGLCGLLELSGGEISQR